MGGIFTHKGQIFRDLSDMKSEKNLIFCGEKKKSKNFNDSLKSLAHKPGPFIFPGVAHTDLQLLLIVGNFFPCMLFLYNELIYLWILKSYSFTRSHCYSSQSE